MAHPLASATPAAVLALFSIGAVLVLRGPASPDAPAALIFPPWWSADRVVAAAASVADLRGAGAAPYVVIVQSRAPDLRRRARSAGAVLTLEGSAVGFCGAAAKV